MKILIPLLTSIFLLSCPIFDRARKGKNIVIHNQINSPILVLDSLNSNLNLYDTFLVNERKYIVRKANYLTEYSSFTKFISDAYIARLRKDQKNIIFYFIDNINLKDSIVKISDTVLYRFIEIKIDTFEKYELNHLFLTKDSILFEHDYNFETNSKK